MSVITRELVKPNIESKRVDGSESRLVVWEGMTLLTPEGEAYAMPGWRGRTAQVVGVGITVIEGSLDGSHWFCLSDPHGDALEFSFDSLMSIGDDVKLIRPRLLNGNEETSVTCSMFFRRLV